MSLGELLNRVEQPAGPCPNCGTRAKFDVYKVALRWLCCGFTHVLPELGCRMGRDCDYCQKARERTRQWAA